MDTPSLPMDTLITQNVIDETDIRSSEGLNSSLEDYEGDSESDSEVILQPGINKNNPANFALAPRSETPPIRNDRSETSVINSDSNLERSVHCNARGPAAVPWMPKMNLLELAYRLKQAEYRVFGPTSGQSTKPPVAHGTGSIAENVADAARSNVFQSAQNDASSKSTNSSWGFPSPQKTNGTENNFAKSAFSQNSQMQKFSASQISMHQSNLLPSAVAAYNNFREDNRNQKLGDFERNKDIDSEMNNFDMSSFVKRESSYSGHDSAYNLPDSMENSSNYFAAESTGGGTSSFDSRRRHQCSFCNYRSDTRSHVRRHELSIHFHGATARHRGSRDFRGASPINYPPQATAASYSMFAPATVPPEGGLLRSDVRRHKCDLCTYSTDSVSHLKRHQCSVHGKEKPFQCTVCLREFSRSEKLKDHFASYHPGLPFDLKSMRKVITTPAVSTPVKAPPASVAPSLIAPGMIKLEGGGGSDAMSTANEGGGVQDEIMQDSVSCGEDSNADADLVELVNASVAAKGAGLKPFGCIQCQYAARDVWHLRRHIADVHLKRRNHRCKVCRYATGRQDRLIMHMRDHGEMFCLYCDYSTAQLAAYRAHVQNCQAGGSRGGVTYWGEWSLLTSEVGQFSEQERTCRLCNVIFAQQCDLETHMYLVHIDTSAMDGMLSCRACGLKTHGEKQMEEHLVSHAPNSYACLTRGCNFRSIYARTLELHQKYYHNPGDEMNAATAGGPSGANPSLSTPASCASESSYSGAVAVQAGATSTTTSLSPVAIMHGVGQFSCPMCTDRPPFKYRRSFEKHLSQHSANVQVCPLCVESFMSRSDLQTHMLIKHGASVV